MTVDYKKIREDNKNRYGWDISRVGERIFVDTYADRTHFIFELLQNAEDAIARRGAKWDRSRTVSFHLTEKHLRISHCGVPFDEADVRGICGIGESTKTENFTEIGRFGLGFKSVYAFTNRPEIHSGPEDFAINSFVWPEAVPSIRDKGPDETVFILPFKPDDKSGYEDIDGGLRGLGAKTLLFLRQIEEICWSVQDGSSGQYLRESKEIDTHVRSVTVAGYKDGESEIHEEWLVFSRPIISDEFQAGHVEIAFFQVQDEGSKCQWIQRVEHSPLVVFFPTAVETNLGFFVQGPYRTTTSRENVPEHDEWNKCLVQETASLLIESLRWLRDQNRLNTAVLRCLPFKSGQLLFTPLFDATKKALLSEPLLPRVDENYVPASRALLGRTGELHNLFSPDQLLVLYGRKHEPAWLSSEITADREPTLRQYLMQELNVPEVTPELIIQKLNRTFLEAQSDDWIQRLYEFLNGRSALRWRLADIPLIRLEDGSHVTPKVNGQPQAFLPSKNKTGFSTVRCSVCVSEEALSFLKSLELAEPNPVDDVILNILPKYQGGSVDITDADYEDDIERMLYAYNTDSKKQQNRLIEELKITCLVKSVDTGHGSRQWSKPGDVYLATERLRELFDGVKGVLRVDDSHTCLRGEKIRELLERCGTVRYLRPIPDDSLSSEERAKLRQQTGYPQTSGRRDRVNDQTLHGLKELLDLQPHLAPERRRGVAELLWEELVYLESRGKSPFTGSYTWTHYGDHKAPSFDAALVRQLKETAWVPDADGKLRRPEFVLFDTLDWKEHPFLQSKIPFKPPIIDQLAKEVGIEPGVLDKIKEHGITEEDLAEWVARREPEKIPDPDNSDSFPSVPSHRRRAHPQPENSINHDDLMELEEKAIKLILAHEPDWQRTRTNNPGYDLYKADEQPQKTHWCEVKSISSSLEGQSWVRLSPKQFEYAQKYGEAYWLYIVEHADDKDRSRIIRIRNPAEKVGTFISNSVWLEIQRDGPSRLQTRFGSDWKNIAT